MTDPGDNPPIDFDQAPAGRNERALFEHWRHLRGQELVTAMQQATWYAMPDDVIGGWCVMPDDLPPSSGLPEIGSFISEVLAKEIADLHNANLTANGDTL